MRIKPAPQHALEQVLGHVLDGAFAQGPRHQGVGQLVEGRICRFYRFGDISGAAGAKAGSSSAQPTSAG